MFESDRDYPTALAAGPEHGDRGLRDELRWLMSMVSEVGGEPLVFAPGRANVEHNQLLSEFVRRSGTAVSTWRSPARGWGGGPVLAAWPTREKLGQIADDPRTRALGVVPWGEGEVDGWVSAPNP